MYKYSYNLQIQNQTDHIASIMEPEFDVPPRRQNSRRISHQDFAMDIEEASFKKSTRYSSKRSFGINLVNQCSKGLIRKTKHLQEGKLKKRHVDKILKANQELAASEEESYSQPTQVRNAELRSYQHSIMEYLSQKQLKYPQFKDFLSIQNDVDEDMRAILVGWIIDVHVKFRLRQKTLYNCINMIDLYLIECPIKRTEFQLLGITALFVSCKYQQIYPPPLKMFAEVCDKTYTISQILEMESLILLKIRFDLSYTSPLCFFNQIATGLNMKTDQIATCSSMLDMCLLEYNMSKYKPSVLALASILLCQKVLSQKKFSASWLMQKYRLEEDTLKQCFAEMSQIYNIKAHPKYSPIHRKYNRAN